MARKPILTSLVIILFFDNGSPLQVAFALQVSAGAHVSHASYCKAGAGPGISTKRGLCALFNVVAVRVRVRVRV